ncbi:MAG: ABC transporter permease [Saprospiraceae bacterium]|nr:ABC transporter permease [Saprospiraceae bacterium]
MLTNYLKIAFRNLKRNRTYSIINLLGLTIGTACCVYILLFVQFHRKFDKHHTDGDRTFRVITDLDISNDGDILHLATCSPPIPFAMKDDFPEVEQATRVVSHPSLEQNLIRYGEKVFYEKKGLYVDSTFFQMFDYHFLEGQGHTALDQPNTLVISRQLSDKIFGGSVALGQIVYIGSDREEQPFTVAGVFDGEKGRSHLMPEFFMSMNSAGIGQYIRTNQSWAGNNFIYGYVRLREGSDASILESKLPDFLMLHGSDQLQQANLQKELFLQPVPAIHTSSGLVSELAGGTSTKFLNLLLLIAGFIQLVACINFMNLSTARSSKRAREVGIRKTVGAPRATIIRQFLGESILLTALSMILAIPFLQLIMPYLNGITGLEIGMRQLIRPEFLLLLVGLIILTGILAGSYPAFFLSSFKPLSVLKGKIVSVSHGKFNLRRGLVVGQFAIAIILVIAALIIRSQLNFLVEKDLGFEKNNKIIIPFHAMESREKLDLFRQELLRNPEISSIAGVSKYPGQQVINDIPLYKQGEDMSSSVDIRAVYIDEGFFETLKIPLLSGRELTRADTTRDGQSLRVVLNRTAIEKLGIPVDEAPGTMLFTDFEDAEISAQIIGVMDDIEYQSLSGEMGPFMVIAEPARNLIYMIADVSTGDLPGLISGIEETWKNFIPEYPFEFSFLDDNLNRLYETERSLAKIISLFTILTILISCLGLFGLSVFAAEQRMKEIGIRKLLGASTFGIVKLMSFDFLRLVALSLIIASPLAYYFADNWLNDFAHRISISGYYFLIAAGIAIGLAFITVSFQSIRAALVNPAESLKSE